MYTHIINPKTGRKVNVLGRQGINILKKYVEALHVMEGGMRGGSGDGADGAAASEAAEYLKNIGYLKKKLIDIRTICRKPGNDWTPVMLHALVDVMKTVKAPVATTSIFEDPLFKSTLLKFRAISLFDSLNEYQVYDQRQRATAPRRPRDIIIPFGEALRKLGEEEEEEKGEAEKRRNIAKNWNAHLPHIFDPTYSESKFELLKECIPSQERGSRKSTGHGGGNYLQPRRLLNIVKGIKNLLTETVFLNLLNVPKAKGDDDDDIFTVFSGIDIEVVEIPQYISRLITSPASLAVLRSLRSAPDESPIAAFGNGTWITTYSTSYDSYTDNLKRDLRMERRSRSGGETVEIGEILDMFDNHRLIGIYRPGPPPGDTGVGTSSKPPPGVESAVLPTSVKETPKKAKVKLAFLCDDTYNKLSRSGSYTHIILKMGQPGHYTIALLDLEHNSIEYFDSEGAYVRAPVDDGGISTINWGIKAHINYEGIDVITPCIFSLQTDDATFNYWEDGYCQSWVWLYIYERLGLAWGESDGADVRAEGRLLIQSALGDASDSGGWANKSTEPAEAGEGELPTVSDENKLKPLIATILYNVFLLENIPTPKRAMADSSSASSDEEDGDSASAVKQEESPAAEEEEAEKVKRERKTQSMIKSKYKTNIKRAYNSLVQLIGDRAAAFDSKEVTFPGGEMKRWALLKQKLHAMRPAAASKGAESGAVAAAATAVATTAATTAASKAADPRDLEKEVPHMIDSLVRDLSGKLVRSSAAEELPSEVRETGRLLPKCKPFDFSYFLTLSWLEMLLSPGPELGIDHKIKTLSKSSRPWIIPNMERMFTELTR